MRAATIAKAATRSRGHSPVWIEAAISLDRLVLCYHRVLPRLANSPLPHWVTPQQFREQMSFLAAEGFRSLTLDDFRAAAFGVRAPPRRFSSPSTMALLTFI
jgi:peptidoglycan/xylan/chitin deacetylase (PgdA/CDA1 family)